MLLICGFKTNLTKANIIPVEGKFVEIAFFLKNIVNSLWSNYKM